MTDRRFGVSTHLFHQERLAREHLVHIAAHGFDAVELFAARSHFDYHDARAIASLGEWLSDARLELHSVHAPTAAAEARAAIDIARVVPYRFLVVHRGVEELEDIVSLAAAAGVKVAIEVMPNALSSAETLVQLIEDDPEGLDVGICLDYGHAHLMGDLVEAIEALSGHLVTTHVHDNRGRTDDHLVPFSGSIDWERAMMATQKIGYEDVLMLEVGATTEPVDVLKRSAGARERLEQTFVTF